MSSYTEYLPTTLLSLADVQIVPWLHNAQRWRCATGCFVRNEIFRPNEIGFAYSSILAWCYHCFDEVLGWSDQVGAISGTFKELWDTSFVDCNAQS
jgi:hypothetical protein